MMKQALPGDALRISADEWNEIRRRVLGDNLTNNRRPVPTEVLYGRAGGSGIPSRTGSAPGSGTVDIYYRDATTGNLTSYGESVTAYNISGTAVDANAWVILGREFITKDFVVIVESCEAAS